MLIFVNRYFYPDHSATSQMLSDLAFGLRARGHDVRVITSRQRYDAPDDLLPAHEVVGGVEVFRAWTSHFGRGDLIGRAVDYATFYFSAAWRLLRLAQAGDTIIAETDPPMLSVVVAPIAHWRGALLVNWIQDLFPEVAEAVGLGRRQLPRFVYGALRMLRDASLRSAAMNVALGEKMAARLSSLGVASDRIAVIPNWADAELIRPIAPKDNPARTEWGLDGAFVVGYSGNLGRAHDYRAPLDAIERLSGASSANLKIRWLFIGGGALYDAFARELRAKGLQDVLFAPYQPRERLSESLSAADVHLVCLRPDLEGSIVPSKFYGVAAAGRPTIFIGDDDGEIARIVRRQDLGCVSPQGDGEQLAARILTLAQDPDRRRDIGARARRLCMEEFDKRVALDRWERLLERLSARRRGAARFRRG
ncbi:glycosyltransferase family 4 protein [Methylosinus sporium]|uniref:glycosyltransferase family 4 protein n=1 Tax=Methylosinus sporium TaxID=428 RepID=UPI00383BCD29